MSTAPTAEETAWSQDGGETAGGEDGNRCIAERFEAGW